MRNALGLLILALVFCASAAANKPLPTMETKTVGNAQPVHIVPKLVASARKDRPQTWAERIVLPGASFVKAHFSNVNLRAGDRIVLVNGNGRVVEEISGRGPKDRGTFWALSAQGETLLLRFEYSHSYPAPPFTVDRVIAGDKDLFAPRVDSGARSICSPGDFQDAVCAINDDGRWDNVRASVGVMSVGGNAATAVFCSGANVTAGNAVLTNQHCVQSQAVCDNSEFVFEFYRSQCNDPGSPLSGWQSFRCDQVLASEPLGDCDASPGTLDFTLASVVGDPASTYGFARIDATPLQSGEGIYIVQHPDGRPHEITSGGGADVVVDGNVLRYYNTLDTEGGSSGSPIYRAADHRLVGLHHCGGCSTPGVGNRGMLMSDIYPQISAFLCNPGADIRPQGAGDLAEVAGNGDASIDPGEQWSFTVSALNNSCALAASDVTAQISVAAGDAILADTTVSFGDLDASASGVSTPVVFTVPADHLCGGNLSFNLDSLAIAGGDTFPGAANIFSADSGQQLQTDLLNEDFDGGFATWAIEDGGSGSGAAATWTTTNPGGRTLTLTAPYAIADSDEHGSGQSMDEGLISQPVDTTPYAQVFVRFVHDFNWYAGGQPEQADVEVRSIVTLGQWTDIANFSGADASGTVILDVTAYSAPDLQIRFHYYNAVYEWWWALDDVQIFGRDPAVCTIFGSDTDGDGVGDVVDNCTLVANADQRDSNGDGYGNVCDADLDNDGVINANDLGLLKLVFFSADPDADLNGDGVVNAGDLGIMKLQFFGAPGPSGVAP